MTDLILGRENSDIQISHTSFVIQADCAPGKN